MPIVMRPYRDEDWPQAAAIWSQAFYGGEIPAGEEPLSRPIGVQNIVAEDEEGIVGATRLVPFRVLCRGEELGAFGLSSVAVAPEQRRQGTGSALLHWILWHLRRSGVAMAPLHAANEKFYRGFGWASSGARQEIKTTVDRLPRLETSLPVHRLRLEDWSDLQHAYEGFARAHSGALRRTGLDRSYIHRVAGNTPLVYAVGQPAEAYAVLRLERNAWDRPYADQRVAEVVWSTPRGYHALLGLLRQLLINTSAIRWFEPADSPFLAQYAERDTEVVARRPVMYRLIDVPLALATLPVDEAVAGTFTMAVFDPQLADNAGPWRVAAEEGRLTVEPCSTDAPDLEIGVGALTQAVLGEPDLMALHRHGAVTVRSPEALALAARLLPPHPVCCLDFF
jgi:predicted acetyltransferase